MLNTSSGSRAINTRKGLPPKLKKEARPKQGTQSTNLPITAPNITSRSGYGITSRDASGSVTASPLISPHPSPRLPPPLNISAVATSPQMPFLDPRSPNSQTPKSPPTMHGFLPKLVVPEEKKPLIATTSQPTPKEKLSISPLQRFKATDSSSSSQMFTPRPPTRKSPPAHLVPLSTPNIGGIL